MRSSQSFRLSGIFLVAFSLACLSGPLSGNFHLPTVQLSHALPQVCNVQTSGGCSEWWVPAGAAEDTFVATIFTDEAAEFTDIQSATPHIDLTDWPLTPDLTGPFTSSTNFRVTSTVSADVNFEIQFMLGNNLWGCDFNFGNSACGVQIRQGVAHMIDTAKYAANEPSCSGQCIALDTPNPPDNVGSLPTPNPCAWDSMFPESGPNCIVGAPGGTAYHLAAATGANGLPYLQAPGSPDLNSAAAHFVAAGVATGFNPTTSVLTGVSSIVSSHTVGFFIRNDNPPRLDLGDAYSEQICWLFTGSYTTPCLPYLNTTHGPITAFPGFTTSTTSVRLSWGMYTAEFGTSSGVSPFDSTYYLIYNSIFASGIPSIQPPNGPCSGQAVPTVSAADYMYLCNQQYDSLTNSMEFAPCLSVPGQSPSVGQTVPHYAACSGTGQESVVNATSPTTTYTGQPVIYGPTPANGARLTPANTLKVGCPAGYTGPTISANPLWVCSSPGAAPVTIPASIVFTPSSDSAYSPPADTIVNGPELPAGSPLTLESLKFVDADSNGVFDLGTPDAFSAGIQAADVFGQAAFTIEAFTQTEQFGYLNNGWVRVDNSVGSGLPGYWTWLNAWNPSPVASGTIRQGFKSTTNSVNPYVATTLWDFFVLGNIYDSLTVTNPLSGNQLIQWMSLSELQLPNSALTYTPPTGTSASFRFTLRNDIFWQDGRHVTPWDVKFSYLTLKATGAFQGGPLSSMTGVTVLSPNQFDVNVKAVGPFTTLTLTTPTIIPGHYWSTCAGSLWDGFVTTNHVPDTCMNADPNKITPNFDPIGNGILVGSGPWACIGAAGKVGTGCSSSFVMNPPVGGSYVLQRFGKGLPPASSVSSIYFRSNGNLAAYLWSQNNGDITHDFLNFSVVASCFGAALTSTGPCAHFQQGIGAGTGGAVPVGLGQVSIVNRFVGLNWIAPFNWATAPPLGILPFAGQVLYEDSITLNPASVVGCTASYPTGGYDC